MKSVPLTIFAILWLALGTAGYCAESKILWQIGRLDHSDAEFALAPDGFEHFQQDGLFVVGQSDPKQDWPYVQPGPNDSWAGGRQHPFTIFFDARHVVKEGECVLELDLLDAHPKSSPTLQIKINGQSFERMPLLGKSDESIRGQMDKNAPQSLQIQFPASLLHEGGNEIKITTLRGSWMLYDSIALNTPPAVELADSAMRTFIGGVEATPALQEQGGKLFQPLSVAVVQTGGETDGNIAMEGEPAVSIHLKNGPQYFEFLAPAVDAPQSRKLALQIGGKDVAAHTAELKPVRHLTVYVLPHSHTDIGYTEAQSAVAKKQVDNLLEGMAAARKTADYPVGARFIWNVEVLWAADQYLHRLDERQRAEFFEAVRNGQVALNGMYANELTGLCRPEELLHLFRYSTELEQQTGVPIDAAMISDVPAATWGLVTAMSQGGIKYLSAAPNWFDRIGDLLVNCEDRPFYWMSRSGADKVLVWVPFKGYATSHVYQKLSPQFVAMYLQHLDELQYPYDISYLRWSGHGDNAAPDPAICDFIRDWNAKYAFPKFIIASTSEAFHAFEQRYADKIPVRSGDWTPYWEDGAGSSALETAMNRANADRLAQAEKLWAMLKPASFPAASFDDAWRNVLLYSEHTWGANVSVSDPESEKTKEQWEVKRSYAVNGDEQSRSLLNEALGAEKVHPGKSSQIDVFNTANWPRSGLVVLPKKMAAAKYHVMDAQGRPVLSQRLSGGELAFIARNVPPFAAARYTLARRRDASADFTPATVQGNVLDNGILHVRLDKKTGNIIELRAKGIPNNLADDSSGQSINEYLFLAGDNLANLQTSGPAKIIVRESGPVVASLVVESGAPGCRSLTREIRLTAGCDYVELINTVNKNPSPLNPDPKNGSFAQRSGKESVNFAFPFNVPDGVTRLDISLSMMEPEVNQIPGACKNWFPVDRWLDVANDEFGVTCVTPDAPLVEVGAITATLLGSQKNPDVWRKKVERSQKFYSWVMNNHWGTNYRASQNGPVDFRYLLEPHGKFDPEDAARLAMDFCQPLIVRPASSPAPATIPRLQLSSDDVAITTFKPSDDGKGWIVRLFGAAGKNVKLKLQWSDPVPAQLWLSDTSERPLEKLNGEVSVPAWGMVTVRAE